MKLRFIVLLLACLAAMGMCGCGTSSSTSSPVTNPTSAVTVTSVSPTTIAANVANTLTVTGTNFTASSVVQVNGTALPTTYISSVQLTATVAANQFSAASAISVVVTDHGTSSAANGPTLTVDNPAPMITQAAPATIVAGSPNTAIPITGTGFLGQTAMQVNGSGRATTVSSATQLAVTVTAADLAAAGTLSLTASNPGPGGGSSSALAVQVINPAPGPITLSPSSTVFGVAAPQVVTVTGSNFTANTVAVINGTARATAVASATQLTFRLLAVDVAAAGNLSVMVVTPSPGGGASAAATLLVGNAVPVITGFSPAMLNAGGNTPVTVTVNGNGFVAGTSLAVNGAARASTLISPTQLTFTLSVAEQAVPAILNVVVTVPAPGGGASSPSAFTVQPRLPLVLNSVTPTTATVGNGFTLHALGSGFVADSVILWNDAPLATQFVSGGELTAAIDASLLTTAGAANINVGSSVAGVSQSTAVSLPINNPAPQLTSVTPALVFRPSATNTLTLHGSGFLPISHVLLNGTQVSSTFVDAATLIVTLTTATVPSGASATVAVSTPAPGGGTSSGVTVNITDQPKPTITDVSLSGPGTTLCGGASLLINGTGFSNYPVVRANGIVISQSGVTYSGPGTFAIAMLPYGTALPPGSTITVQSASGTDNVSDPFLLPVSITPRIGVCATPTAPTVYAGSVFALDFTTLVINAAGAPSLTNLTLPSGFSLVAPASVPFALNGTRVLVRVDPSVPAGSVSLPFTASLGNLTFNGTVPVTVTTGSGTLAFASGLTREIAVPIGGSVTFTEYTLSSGADFVGTIGVSGLPTGVTATISPTQAIGNQTVTFTLTADASAPRRQNVPISITSTVEGGGTSSLSLLLQVTQAPGTIPNNRNAFTSLDATPTSAVYDAVHDVVYASNAAWNRIDVISNQTHKMLRSVPVPSPTYVDMSPDSSTLWIGTGTQQVFALDTTTFLTRRYLLPDVLTYGTSPSVVFHNHWGTLNLVSLNDGSLLLSLSAANGGYGLGQMVWSPDAGQLSYTGTAGGGYVRRSGDGRTAFSLGQDSTYPFACNLNVYTAATRSFATYSLGSTVAGTSYCGSIQAVNRAGTVVVQDVSTTSGNNVRLLSGTGQVLGSLTPSLQPKTLQTNATTTYYQGSFTFGPNDGTLYEIAIQGVPVVAAFDVSSRTLTSLAPAMNSTTTPLTSGYGGTSQVFGADATGMVLGIQEGGIAFEDSTYVQDFTNMAYGELSPASFQPQSGPLTGGTTIHPYGYAALQPDVWFGDVRGTSAFSQNTLSLTSPAASTPGPVDLKLIYPNGVETYQALGFSYGPAPQQSVYSGAPPDGGVTGTITGFGLPQDSSGGSVAVGGLSATITSTVGQYPAFTGADVQSTYLKFTVPPGAPGYADVRVQTPDGSGTLSRAIFYASSVNNYSVSGTPRAVLYDKARKLAYVATQTQLLVFDAAGKQFVSPLTVPTVNGVLDLRDLALSVDGTKLLVGNAGDGSLAVLDPTGATPGYAIALPALVTTGSTCAIGPGAVAAIVGNRAMVFPQPPIGSSGCGYISKWALVDLGSHTAVINPSYLCDTAFFRPQVQSTADGSLALLLTGDNGNACTYAPGVTSASFYYVGFSGAVAADGNVFSGDLRFVDGMLNALGTLAQPNLLYGTPLTPSYPANPATQILRNARLNDSGSLYFIPHAGYFEIVDVPTATLRMRFALRDTVQDVNEPISIDSGGRQVFLITSAGLTVVDLGQAPLGVGHVQQSGQTLQVRGSGFVQDMSATLDGNTVVVTVSDENTLSVTLPVLTAGGHDLTLMRTDGSSYTYRGALITH